MQLKTYIQRSLCNARYTSFLMEKENARYCLYTLANPNPANRIQLAFKRTQQKIIFLRNYMSIKQNRINIKCEEQNI